MLKSVFVFLNLFGLLIFPFLNIEDVEITHEAPSEIQQGQNVEVLVTIKKGDFSGPGRLKLNFENAEGLSASEIENAGASFTFKDNEALYIWYSIPSEETITIKYNLHANQSTIGNKKITGTFSYLDESERKQVEIPSLFITVSDKPIANNNEINQTINCTRTITESGNHYIVKIHTNKNNEKGFARIKDNLPVGFKAEPIETAGSVFKNIDNAAKFLWSELPASLESFTVSYKLIPDNDSIEEFTIEGTFSAEFLMLNDQSNKIIIPATIFKKQDQLANNNEGTGTEETSTNETTTEETTTEETTTEETTTEETTTEETTTEETTTEETTTEETTTEETNTEETNTEETTTEETTTEETTTEETTTEETNSTINNETIIENQNNLNTSSVNYKVQILAAHRTTGQKYFKKRHNYSESFDIENHEGWVKYTIGEFQKYKTARDKRESLTEFKFPGPFVTAYNNGDRITVQEALMISKQDWTQ